MKKRIIFFILLIALQTSLFSQTIPEIIVHDSTTLYEKLYLHLDRERSLMWWCRKNNKKKKKNYVS